MTLWNTAAGLVQQWCPACEPVTRGIGAGVQLRTLLEVLSEAEQETDALRQSVVRAANLGVAVDVDYTSYNRIRSNLFLTQLEVEDIIRGVITRVAESVGLAELPRPAVMPALNKPLKAPRLADPSIVPQIVELTPTGARASAGLSGLGQVHVQPPAIVAQEQMDRAYVSGRGLGGAQALAVGAVVANPWFWAAAALIVLAALGLLAVLAYFLGETISTQLAHVFTVREQGRMYKSLIEGRIAAYEACLNSGTPELECRRAAGIVVPTPEEAGLEPAAVPTGAYKYIVWTAAGIAGVVGLAWFFRTDTGKKLLRRTGLKRGVQGLGRARRLRSLNDPYPSRYNLEI